MLVTGALAENDVGLKVAPESMLRKMPRAVAAYIVPLLGCAAMEMNASPGGPGLTVQVMPPSPLENRLPPNVPAKTLPADRASEATGAPPSPAPDADQVWPPSVDLKTPAPPRAAAKAIWPFDAGSKATAVTSPPNRPEPAIQGEARVVPLAMADSGLGPEEPSVCSR